MEIMDDRDETYVQSPHRGYTAVWNSGDGDRWRQQVRATRDGDR